MLDHRSLGRMAERGRGEVVFEGVGAGFGTVRMFSKFSTLAGGLLVS